MLNWLFGPKNFGWRNDPRTVDRHLAAMAAQNGDPRFVAKALPLLYEDDNADVFFWELEEKLLGQRLPTYNQLNVGSCEGHGNGRAAQDTILIAACDLAPTDDGTPGGWPGKEVSPEITYANGRTIDSFFGGDGGTGAGTARGLVEIGVALRGVYGDFDFSNGYPENTSAERRLAGRPVPQSIRDVCAEHRIKDAALVSTGADAWAAIGAYKPVSISGQISRTMKRQQNGFCPRTGNDWSHCQCFRGRCTVKGGKRAVVYSNSWGDYLGSDNAAVQLESGRTVTLPPGHYLAELDDVERDLKMRDSFAFTHVHSWRRPVIDFRLL